MMQIPVQQVPPALRVAAEYASRTRPSVTGYLFTVIAESNPHRHALASQYSGIQYFNRLA